MTDTVPWVWGLTWVYAEKAIWIYRKQQDEMGAQEESRNNEREIAEIPASI